MFPPSVLRLCPPLEILAIYLARESSISSTVFVQRNGLGLSFHALIQSRTSSPVRQRFGDAVAEQLVGEKTEPAFPWLIQEERVRVKCM